MKLYSVRIELKKKGGQQTFKTKFQSIPRGNKDDYRNN